MTGMEFRHVWKIHQLITKIQTRCHKDCKSNVLYNNHYNNQTYLVVVIILYLLEIDTMVVDDQKWG